MSSHDRLRQATGPDNRYGGRHVTRRRAPAEAARTRQVFVRLSAQEHADLTAAARRSGLTTTSFVAEAALATARGRQPPDAPVAGFTRAELAALQRTLFALRTGVGRIETALRQAAGAFDQAPPWLAEASTACQTLLTQLDDRIAAVDERLR